MGGESIRKFASRLSVSEGTMRSYLRGVTCPDLKILAEIAEAAGVSMTWLATGEGPMRRTRAAEHISREERSEYHAWADRLIDGGAENLERTLSSMLTESILEMAVQLAEEQLEARGERLSPREKAKYLSVAIRLYDSLPPDQRDKSAGQLFGSLIDLITSRPDDSARD